MSKYDIKKAVIDAAKIGSGSGGDNDAPSTDGMWVPFDLSGIDSVVYPLLLRTKVKKFGNGSSTVLHIDSSFPRPPIDMDENDYNYTVKSSSKGSYFIEDDQYTYTYLTFFAVPNATIRMEAHEDYVAISGYESEESIVMALAGDYKPTWGTSQVRLADWFRYCEMLNVEKL